MCLTHRFISRHYELVSVKDMEDHLGLSRGVIFYHYRDKLDLFKNVIDKYVINKQQLYGKIEMTDVTEETTLREFIDIYLKGARQVIEYLYNTLREGEEIPVNKNALDRSYLELSLYAGHYYPAFNKAFQDSVSFELNTWIKIINKAIENKEIRPVNPELTAQQFQSMYYGEGFLKSFKEGVDVENLRDLFLNFYSILKN
ncbi:MAG: TetR/AcrR family transcriptional regulator, partial [Tannerellaceae bacterium]|nr:TetR/AcrR family transcriptional regulator [Tannerellaceae bacterium]